FDVSCFLQSLTERSHSVVFAAPGIQKPDHRHRRLLRPRRERPARYRAAEQRDELAAPDHSITSSAVASTLAGISMPSALAVLRLSTSSKRVGCTAGSSDGFSPFKMRPA